MKDLTSAQEAQLNDITISEVFGPTLQGEGPMMGEATLFVRTAGCDYRCTWCDTLYAVDPAFKKEWRKENAQDIMHQLESLSQNTPMWVTLSGGNPALFDMAPLIELGQSKGYRFAMETQGSVVKDWFGDLDALTLSPKGPSSGMEIDWDILAKAVNANKNTSLKIVIFDDADYAFAQEVAVRFPDTPLCLQVGSPQDRSDDAMKDTILNRLNWLSEKIVADRWFTAKVLPQMHVLTWGSQRGV